MDHDSMDHGHQYSLWQQHGPQTLGQTMEMEMDMASGGKPRPRTSACRLTVVLTTNINMFQMAAQTTDTKTVNGGNTNHRHGPQQEHKLWTMYIDTASVSSMVSDDSMAFRVSTDHGHPCGFVDIHKCLW